MTESEQPMIEWTVGSRTQSAQWRSERGAPPPRRVVTADDTMSADTAYRLACEGTALLWKGDYHNARQLLQAMSRRVQRSRRGPSDDKSIAERFHLHRQAQAQQARTLGMVLVPVAAGHRVSLRRAPDVAEACMSVFGAAKVDYAISLRELLGLVGAYQWRLKGVSVPALDATITPHYGVFSPIRGEYVDLVAQAPLPATTLAFDIGTGSGVLAAVLVKRGIKQVVATDTDPRALACALDNLTQLGVAKQVALQKMDLFPEGRAPLIVCNPPWVPARPSAPIEAAVYDPDSRMLRGFLAGLVEHLAPGGEGWLILSDLAEHLGLRTREELLAWIDAAGLAVHNRHEIRPRHAKAQDTDDPLHAARAAEMTTLWRLVAKRA
ncbi:50S ribosomal protein L11 methyltransferase [Denitromonas halophila]|uniref:Class I SAM-dependent methyltransferase n=1 Tax=Denitromonas halophila TaxID=1629404 RepID=A0A557QQW1_9RHOO|nr:class I SAM-dependent methyltransferase [Denitromonas halophila]TVO55283.1 class I SAM-dependent methyltransferase [Denitromonas halophila]